MEIKINCPELSQTEISNQLGTSSESVRQLIESSGKKYKMLSENISKRKELELDPSFNIEEYENVGFTKSQIDIQKKRILKDLLEVENITKTDIQEISNLSKGYIGKIISEINKTNKTKTKLKPEITTTKIEEKKPEKTIETKQQVKEEPSLYDTLTLEQKMKLAMYKPKKINFLTFNRDLALGKFD